MSDGDRRLRVIALGFAGVAMVIAVAAAVMVVRRGDTHPAPENQPRVAQVSDHTVAASEVVKLQ